ncbi:MAG: exodeoxyribonuclease VII small subunit [Neisseriaceae bacterium]|nr:MAG: exodeoxyribonuclease VII small subunit [Neisseriaceae bacterium]
MTKKNSDTFESAINQLEIIIQQIENEQIDLESALNQYKHGMELVKFCQDKLRDVEQKIKILDHETNQLKNFQTE